MVAAPLALAAVERGAVADRDEGVLEPRRRRGWCAWMSPVATVGDAERGGELLERGVPAGVAALERSLQLDVERARKGPARAARPRSGR